MCCYTISQFTSTEAWVTVFPTLQISSQYATDPLMILFILFMSKICVIEYHNLKKPSKSCLP
jgi:hypothetical protein